MADPKPVVPGNALLSFILSSVFSLFLSILVTGYFSIRCCFILLIKLQINNNNKKYKINNKNIVPQQHGVFKPPSVSRGKFIFIFIYYLIYIF